MPIGARDYYEKLLGAGSVGWNPDTGGVTVNVGGQSHDLGNQGLTLGEDDRYYAPSEGYLNKLLVNKLGYLPLRDTLQSSGDMVDWQEGQLITGGKRYNTNTGDYINIDGNLYASKDKIESLKTPTYANPYQDQIQANLKKLMDSKFSYNPNKDMALKQAQDQAMRRVGEEMNARGILDSSLTTHYTQQAAQDLVPQYEQMAYGRYQDEQSNYYNLVNTLSNLSTQELQVWQANQTEKYNNSMLTINQKLSALEEQRDKKAEALNRTNMTGVVSNEDAVVLGVAPGTFSQTKREAIEAEERAEREAVRQHELVKEQLEYGHELDMKALAERLELENKAYESKTDIDYLKQLEYGPQLAEQQYQLNQKYAQPRATGGGGGGRNSGGGGGGGDGNSYGNIAALLNEDDNDAQQGTNQSDPMITNKSVQGDWVYVGGIGRVSYPELQTLVSKGKVKERQNKDGSYTYIAAPKKEVPLWQPVSF